MEAVRRRGPATQEVPDVRGVCATLQRRLLSAARRHYGSRLVSLVVYGSVGRGTPRPDSDLDFLIVARGLPDGRVARVEDYLPVERSLGPSLARLRAGGFHVELSPIFKTPEEASGGNLLYLDMIEDGVLLFDRDRFFAGVLDRMRARLEELGSKRIRIGSAWYWDLKPGLKPGEVFEL